MTGAESVFLLPRTRRTGGTAERSVDAAAETGARW